MRRGLLVALLAVLLMAASTAAPAAPAATCTAKAKAARVAAAKAYAKRMPAQRRAYFRKHHNRSQRRKFVAKQRKRLAHLGTRARCTVPAPDFGLGASAGSVSVQAGGGPVTTLINVVPAHGFSAPVTFSASAANGLTVTFSPSSSATSTTVSVTAAADATVGSQTLTITGTGGGESHTVALAVEITPAADFSLSSSTDSVSVRAGDGASTATIRVVPANGFSRAVSFSASAVSGLTVTFNPSSSATSTTVSVTAALDAPVGTETLTITGAGGGKSRTVTLTVDVASACPTLADGTYFTYGSAVSDAEKAEIEDDIQNVGEQYLARLGIAPSRVDVRAYGDATEGAQAYATFYGMPLDQAQQQWAGQVASAGREGHCGAVVLFVNMANSFWQSAGAAARAKVLSHELYHVAQNALVGPPGVIGGGGDTQVPRGGPQWLIEGSAEYSGYAAAGAAGLLDFATTRTGELGATATTDDPLTQFDTRADVNAAPHPGAIYTIGFTAVDLLVQRRGVVALAAYWRAIGSGSSWDVAFQTVFGETVQQFYADFAAYRLTL